MRSSMRAVVALALLGTALLLVQVRWGGGGGDDLGILRMLWVELGLAAFIAAAVVGILVRGPFVLLTVALGLFTFVMVSSALFVVGGSWRPLLLLAAVVAAAAAATAARGLGAWEGLTPFGLALVGFVMLTGLVEGGPAVHSCLNDVATNAGQCTPPPLDPIEDGTASALLAVAGLLVAIAGIVRGGRAPAGAATVPGPPSAA